MNQETGTQVTLSSQTRQGINPEKESFWGSKSMILLVQDNLHDLIYVLIGAVAFLGFQHDLSTLLLGMAGIRKTGTAAGVARNILVDGQARKEFNQLPPPPPTNRPTSNF